MNYWLISDTHFGHLKLEQWGLRSGDWQTMLWRGIAELPAGDTLIHMGDICIGDDQAVHEKFANATAHLKTVLVRGNHDHKSAQWYAEHGWGFVCDGIEMLFQGHSLYLTHRPQPARAHSTFNIHGHTHGDMHRSEEYVAYYDPAYHIDISPEIRGFAPLRLDTLIKSTGK